MTGQSSAIYLKKTLFLKEITIQQLEALYLGFPDNASTILLMAMILKLILVVTKSLVENVVTIRANHFKKNAQLYLEKSLFYNLSEALGVPTNMENRTLKILKMMILLWFSFWSVFEERWASSPLAAGYALISTYLSSPLFAFGARLLPMFLNPAPRDRLVCSLGSEFFFQCLLTFFSWFFSRWFFPCRWRYFVRLSVVTFSEFVLLLC